MKLKFNVLAVALLSTIASLSVSAAPVSGSNANRAPLPSNRPADYVRVTRLAANPAMPAQSVLIATHIGGPTANQLYSAIAPRQPVVALATPIAKR